MNHLKMFKRMQRLQGGTEKLEPNFDDVPPWLKYGYVPKDFGSDEWVGPSGVRHKASAAEAAGLSVPSGPPTPEEDTGDDADLVEMATIGDWTPDSYKSIGVHINGKEMEIPQWGGQTPHEAEEMARMKLEWGLDPFATDEELEAVQNAAHMGPDDATMDPESPNYTGNPGYAGGEEDVERELAKKRPRRPLTKKELEDEDPLMRDIIRSIPWRGREGPQFNPRELPVFQGLDMRYYDPDYGREDLLLMAQGGRSDVPGYQQGTGNAGMFASAGQQYGIDPNLLQAIFQFETGGGGSSQWQHKNNPGGLYSGGRYTNFPSQQAGINAMARNLKTNYIDKGLTTIDQIAAKWAPPGAKNDPNNTNNQWANAVKKFYRKHTGKSYGSGQGGLTKHYGTPGNPLLRPGPLEYRPGDYGGGPSYDPSYMPPPEYRRSQGVPQGQVTVGNTYSSGGVEYALTTDPKNPGYVALTGPNAGQVVRRLPEGATPVSEGGEGGGGGGAQIPGGPFEGWTPQAMEQWHSGTPPSGMNYPEFTGNTAGPGGQQLAYETTSYNIPGYGWVPRATLNNAQASTNLWDYLNPWGGTTKGGAGTGVPTQKAIGTAVGTASNFIIPGLGFVTGPIARYITSLFQKNPGITREQIVQAVSAKAKQDPTMVAPPAAPPQGSGFDPWGNPDTGNRWSNDFGRGMGGPSLSSVGGTKFGQFGTGFGTGTVGNFNTAIGFGGSYGGGSNAGDTSRFMSGAGYNRPYSADQWANMRGSKKYAAPTLSTAEGGITPQMGYEQYLQMFHPIGSAGSSTGPGGAAYSGGGPQGIGGGKTSFKPNLNQKVFAMGTSNVNPGLKLFHTTQLKRKK